MWENLDSNEKLSLRVLPASRTKIAVNEPMVNLEFNLQRHSQRLKILTLEIFCVKIKARSTIIGFKKTRRTQKALVYSYTIADYEQNI